MKMGIKTFSFVIRFLAFSALLCLTVPFFNTLDVTRANEYLHVLSSEQAKPVQVIIDPGHGGIDCGGVGVDGVLEKDLNLKISKILCELLRANGINAITTRTEDKMLDLDDPSLSGTHKMRDLKNRLAVAKQHPQAIFVSIHMNKFAQSKYSGLQVWYSKNTQGSALLAQELQAKVKQCLLPQNDRKAKAADSSMFLLDRAVGDAVLIECGFLSNPEECAALESDEYQKQLVCAIFSVLSEACINKEAAPK